MAHDEDHRAEVRSAVESALQRLVWDPGMCGSSVGFAAVEGGVMAIGNGCFLVRPSKRRSDPPQTTARDDIGVPCNSTIPDMAIDETPDTTSSGTRTTETSAQLARENGTGSLVTGGGDMEVRRHVNVPTQESGRDVDDAACAVEETIVEKSKQPRLQSQPQVVNVIDFSAGGNDDWLDASVANARANVAEESDADVGNSRDTSSQNHALKALLQNMTNAAEISVEQTCGFSGTTAIIILDAPLIYPAKPGLFSSTRNPPHPSPSAHEVGGRHDTGFDGTDQHIASNVDSFDMPPAASVSPGPDERRDHSASSPDRHPAGLGDPDKALAALLLWIGEGDSAHGWREVLLVCGSDPGGQEGITDSCQQNDGTFGDASGLAKNTMNTVHPAGVDKKKQNNETRAEDVDVVVGGCPPDGIHGANDAVGDSRESGNTDRPRIRQIVLGGAIPNAFGHGENLSTREGVTPQNPERFEVLNESIAPERGEGYRVSQPPGPTQPPLCAAKRPPRSLRANPAEVLLQTRPAPLRRDTRVAVMFPPPLPALARVGSDGSQVAEKSNGSGEAEKHTKNDHLAIDGKELPRVLVGPVIGRVDPTAAVVLVEVDEVRPIAAAVAGVVSEKTVEDAVGVQLIDTLTGQTHEVIRGEWTGEPGCGPRVFEFESLTPGRRYALRLLGVRPQDQVKGNCSQFYIISNPATKPVTQTDLLSVYAVRFLRIRRDGAQRGADLGCLIPT